MADHVDRLVRKFGGTRRMARITKRSPSQIQHWKRSGVIPQKHWPALLADAERMGIAISAGELVGAIEPAAAE